MEDVRFIRKNGRIIPVRKKRDYTATGGAIGLGIGLAKMKSPIQRTSNVSFNKFNQSAKVTKAFKLTNTRKYLKKTTLKLGLAAAGGAAVGHIFSKIKAGD